MNDQFRDLREFIAVLRASGVRRYSGPTPTGTADLELAPMEPESPGIVVSEVKPGQGEILTALNRLDALLKPNGAI